ncbi:MAG: phosphoadenosine phosphosulfate reductase family protein [Wenzhouxiangella sp.]|nr:phosphoadenosine phosphosulfate reductase family protein [Wenzhouxiangella sp.]
MNHVVMMSGGIGSWAAAKLVAAQHGTDDMVLLFTDTKFEDEDTYRFLHEAAENVGAPLEVIEDGRDIWEVFRDKKFLANSRVDVCSRILKRELADKWIAERYTPENVICYTGIDWTEIHRHERLSVRKLPWIYKAPLCEPPMYTKAELHEWATSEGLKKQRLYEMGLPHANCGGGCVKAGTAHFRQLWEKFPKRYELWEKKEQELYKQVPNVRPFLRVTIEGVLHYISLKQFREEYLEPTDGSQIDLFDWGGCGCYVDD